MPRRARKRTVISPEFLMDSDDRFARQKAAEYLLRTVTGMKKLEAASLELVFWIVGGKGMSVLLEHVTAGMPAGNKRIVDDSWLGVPDTVETSDDIDALQEVLPKLNQRAAARVRSAARDMLAKLLAVEEYDQCPLRQNMAAIQQTFRLSDLETDLVMFAFLLRVCKPFNAYYEDHLECETYSGRRHLAFALNVNSWELREALSGQLGKLGIVTMDGYSLDLDDDVLKTLQQGRADQLYVNYFRKTETSDLPLNYHLLPSETVRHVLGLLAAKGESSTHILLYGPPGTGKTSFARALAGKLNCPAYEIVHQEDNSAQGLRKAIQACLNVTNSGDGSLMIVDESEGLLEAGRSFFDRGEVRDKGWLNQLLETPGVRAIWITNEVDCIDDSTKRRFAFSLCFTKFNRSKRMILWKFVLRHHEAGNLLTVGQIKALADTYDLNAGILATAVQKAKELHGEQNQEKFHAALRRSLDAYQLLAENGVPRTRTNELQRDYSLEGLNYNSNGPDFLGRMNLLTKAAAKSPSAGISALFYGPPGTGKSEMAKYLGWKLNRKLVVKSASDLLDPYVGMSERRIALAFQEATEEQGILVIDEVDTFLSSRGNAQRSWEVSMVNEFLTQMEHYKGILVCTTNNFSWLDRAALRRFLFKVEFDYLLPSGNIVFYHKLLGHLVAELLTDSQTEQIRTIARLTPGDFRVVRDQTLILPESELNHAMLIESLECEAQARQAHGDSRKVGFC
ncbi:AAA+-type ATPase, SpoVK/Ycf46/Vps4 family [Desulfonatronum thiosulfatophilum]|uniref:AAA+-type ATPase, SpoVK/Ycf46/Vps4 family n=1 Tax=Desulfonatronum thiosulfatophilum TaxID=617002 RepID=A0A1G6DDY5_9BACT|nr:ATP-binding protein [Desulfonatronum thiosulfatophilum]SDB43338.1 AAA+-type ATPase, SpoVK/Ycf46/Vps4 family [Desulfonatronum thiosulfatophilum]